MTVKKLSSCLLASLLFLGGLPSGSLAQESVGSDSIAEALKNGTTSLGLRYRLEFVDQDGFASDAKASTARLRLAHKTGQYQSVSGFIELDYVGELLLNDFNSLSGSSPERNRYPVIADGKGTDLNQLYLDFAPNDSLKLRLGRQRIWLLNQRFVGGAGWRQNEQTFDAAVFDFKSSENMSFNYSYITGVRRIFGERVSAGYHDVDAHVMNADIGITESWSVAPYYLRVDNEDAAALSTATFGVRLTGQVPVSGKNKLGISAEFANQSDIANNPVNYDASYLHLNLNYAFENVKLGLGYESLEGDASRSGAAFRISMGSLHGFQGWADRFLGMPDAGIEDLYLSVGGKIGRWNLTGVYHDFSAEDGSSDWGSEMDFSASTEIFDSYGLLLKAARYNADAWSVDTTKLWVMFTANFSL